VAANTYYELLELTPQASAEDVKRAFRAQIAKYHPDKVQHLGKEFQDIAASKAADLTRAYKTLTDPAARAEYDGSAATAEPHSSRASATQSATATATAPSATETSTEPVSDTPPSSAFQQDRAGANDLVQRATVMRFRTSLTAEFRSWEEFTLQGFEVACTPSAAFWSLKLPPRVLGRFVPQVDGKALTETWNMASRIPKDSQRELCVIFLMGPSIAPAGELATAVNDARRRPTSTRLMLVPVNTRTWSAHVPTDAPQVARALVTRLKTM